MENFLQRMSELMNVLKQVSDVNIPNVEEPILKQMEEVIDIYRDELDK